MKFEWYTAAQRGSLDGLSPTARHVALWMATFAAKDGTRIFPGVEVLMALSGVSRASVRRALAEIREYGAIVLHQKGNRRLGHADEYRLQLPPYQGSRVSHGDSGSGLTGDGSGLIQGGSGLMGEPPIGQYQQVISQQIRFTITATGAVTVTAEEPDRRRRSLDAIASARTIRELQAWYNDTDDGLEADRDPVVRSAYLQRRSQLLAEPRSRPVQSWRP